MSSVTRRALLGILACLALAASGAAPASARTVWLCKPGMAANPCEPTLDTTRFSAWGAREGVVTPRRDRSRSIDCFYVYPTVSDQEPTQADRSIDPELRDIALYQASRYSQHCRVYAPVYRQITVRGLTRADATPAQLRTAQADIAEAWQTYLARHNRGRGVVIIGHSQGGYQLQQLIRTKIEPRPAVRRRIVSALLLGANVTVRKGRDTGGVFRHLRACRSATQLGCVVAFSAFNQTPPADARFGRTANRYAAVFGQPTGRRYEVLCTNPAALRGGSGRLDLILPSRPFAPGTLIGAGNALLRITPPLAETTYIEFPGAFSGRCSREGGAHVLRVTARNGTPEPTAAPDPTWGLHLLDANIALGNLVDLVRRQARAYAARR